MCQLSDANLSRMSPIARSRAIGDRPDIPCPEAAEFQNGLEAYWRGADLDDSQPIAWRQGWRAGRNGRKPVKEDRKSDLGMWAWIEGEWERGMQKRAYCRNKKEAAL